MPRSSGTYSAPSGTLATTATPISSSAYNAFVNDLVSDLNAARPITAGGTGATTAPAALTALGLTATAAELNILDGATVTTAEVNALDGVTATGTALIVAADAAAGRAAINAIVPPTASAGLGEWRIATSSAGAALTLPAGSTKWAYFAFLFNSGVVTNSTCGVAAGGTTVGSAVGGQNWSGFIWRVE